MQSDDLELRLERIRMWLLNSRMPGHEIAAVNAAAEIKQAIAERERLVAERDEARAQAEWWKKCDWWEGGQHDYHRSRATRLEAGLLKLRPGDGTDAERLAAIEQETGLSFTPKLTTHLEPHPAEAQRDKLKEALKFYADLGGWKGRFEQDSPSSIMHHLGPVLLDRGARARQALGDTL